MTKNKGCMYFCYVDESGDCGAFDKAKPDKTGSPFFILAGIVVHSSKWRISLDTLKSFRKKIAREAFIPYDVEFHCSEIVDPHKIEVFRSISIADRWMLIEEYAGTMGQNTSFKLIAIVIDKKSTKLEPDKYLTTAITKLYQAFEEMLKKEQENGIVFFDRANEKYINTHVRKMLGTGASGEIVTGLRIGWIIEDPIFRNSSESIFVQSADVIAYTLKEKEFPKAARQKLQAHKIFDRKLIQSVYKSAIADEDGIIRI
jgi:hypothetical protein